MGVHKIPPDVPDYRIYKVEDIKQLMRTKRTLAQQGLKDPWLRNEVWRYPQEYGTGRFKFLVPLFFTGFYWGVGAFVATVAGEKIYHHFYPKKEHGHH